MQEVELSEVLDDLFLDGALEGEVELLEGLPGGEPGGLDPVLPAVGLPGGQLGREDGLEEPLVRPSPGGRGGL